MALKTVLSRTAFRWNLVASGVLLIALVVLINTAVRGVNLRMDVSEDQLFAPSPELKERLGELDDLLIVSAYFTASPEHGAVQIAKSRLVSQLKDFEDDAKGRMRLEFFDPNSSSAAKLDALRLGIQPFASRSLVGGGASASQEVWLGLSLKYRGRERAIPVAMPQILEFAFASELFRLTRDRIPRIGFYARDEAGGQVGWGQARRTLGESGKVVRIEHLSTAGDLDQDLDLLVVVGPRQLHPRAAFAIDQFVQGGGRVIMALEQYDFPINQAPATRYATGLEKLLEAWDLQLSDELVWDPSGLEIGVQEHAPDGSLLPRRQMVYPYWVDVLSGGLSKDLPVTARLNGVGMRWAQALLATEEGAPGLQRVDMVQSSEKSFLAPSPGRFITDPDLLDSEAAGLAGSMEPGRHALAVSLSGIFPSAFAAGEAPVAEDLVQAIMGAGEWDGETTDERVVQGEEPGNVVVFADTDWLRPAQAGGRWDPDSGTLLANLVDWMLLEEDLVALRSRFPRDRPLDDFLDEERSARGITDLGAMAGLDEAETKTQAQDDAEAAATSRRRMVLAKSIGGSVLMALLAMGLPGFIRRRRAAGYELPKEAA